MVFDVNETLSDLTPLRARFEDVGAPADLMPTWFAGALRDGFALTAAGAYADFASVALDGLRALLPDVDNWVGDVEAAARHILDGFAHLEVHPDVPDGVRKLSDAGFRLVTITNGSAALTQQLLGKAGLVDRFEALLDVHGPRRWKPAPFAYQYAAEQVGVRPEQTLLVAVHPWDVDGEAARPRPGRRPCRWRSTCPGPQRGASGCPGCTRRAKRAGARSSGCAAAPRGVVPSVPSRSSRSPAD
ncbi:haloacid dehalogenase type II [Streptomyces albicerus]|uniref:haloacid dehalogenase type II n=1 Tax=Streptomyces albicerus TaxID=2569859 RepID=UPI00384C4DC2